MFIRKIAISLIIGLLFFINAYAEVSSDPASSPIWGDLDLFDGTPHLEFCDTDDNTAYMWHLDTSTNATPNRGYSLFRGTDDGTGFLQNKLLMWFNNSTDELTYYDDFSLTGTLKVPTITAYDGTAPNFPAGLMTDDKINGNSSYAQINSSKKMRGMFTFTFDHHNNEREFIDTYKSVFDTYGFKATLFYVTSFIDAAGDYTAAELTSLVDDGYEVASHSETHADLTTLTADQIDRECRKSKWNLENAITSKNYVCKTFAAGGYSASADATVNIIA